MVKTLSEEEIAKLTPEEKQKYLDEQQNEGKENKGADTNAGEKSNAKTMVTRTGAHGPIDHVDPSILPEEFVQKGYVHASVYEDKLRELSMQVGDQQKALNQLRKNAGGVDINETAATPTIPEKPVSVNGKSYKFQFASFTLPGHGRITAEDAVVDKNILADILKINGQGILKEVH